MIDLEEEEAILDMIQFCRENHPNLSEAKLLEMSSKISLEYKHKAEMEREPMLLIESWDGALVRVPESQAEEFTKQQEEMKRMADKGQVPKAPEEFTQKMLELFKGQK